MAQPQRALVAHAEDLGLIPSTYTAGHNHLELQFEEIQLPLLRLPSTRHVVHRQACGQNMHIHKIKTNKKRAAINLPDGFIIY